MIFWKKSLVWWLKHFNNKDVLKDHVASQDTFVNCALNVYQSCTYRNACIKSGAYSVIYWLPCKNHIVGHSPPLHSTVIWSGFPKAIIATSEAQLNTKCTPTSTAYIHTFLFFVFLSSEHWSIGADCLVRTSCIIIGERGGNVLLPQICGAQRMELLSMLEPPMMIRERIFFEKGSISLSTTIFSSHVFLP